MSKFNTGDRVQANYSVQGLIRDHEYEVIRVNANEYAWGTFFTYVVRSTSEPLVIRHVVNGHVNLRSSILALRAAIRDDARY